MKYTKPDLVVLGEATLLIQGSKQPAGDAGHLELPISQDCELDD